MNHIEGSHYVLVKEGSNVHLSVPVHRGKDLGIGLLKKLIEKAGLNNEQYVAYFSINEVLRALSQELVNILSLRNFYKNPSILWFLTWISSSRMGWPKEWKARSYATETQGVRLPLPHLRELVSVRGTIGEWDL